MAGFIEFDETGSTNMHGQNVLKECGRLLAIVLLLGFCGSAFAQSTVFSQTKSDVPELEIPAELTPEVVDGFMSRLTDADIRALLRDELVRRADEQARQSEEPRFVYLLQLRSRLTEMSDRIGTRLVRWGNAILNIAERREKVAERLGRAQAGTGGMLVSALLLVIAGFAAAWIVIKITEGWRTALLSAQETGYWEKVIRTFVLTLVELLPVFVFVFATQFAGAYLAPWLGPLVDQVWIYQTGVSNAWGLIVLAKRAFAPQFPHMRIASLHDNAATNLFATVKVAIVIGALGWVMAGFFPTLGFGFPPALLTVAAAGTLVTAYLIYKIVINVNQIRDEVASDVSDALQSGALGRTLAAASPYLLIGYLLFAWVYWLAFWLERGQHELAGPLGTLGVLLVLPIVDRFGREMVTSLSRSESEIGLRVQNVFRSSWSALVVVVAIGYIFSLWAIGILEFAKGEDAPAWAGTVFDIIVTLLIGLFVWRLVGAALHTEKRVATGEEDASPDAPGASRLDTLTPLFRNVLLGFLFVVIAMIILSDIGIDIGPLIASAGIVGIAVGFGAQTLVRDIFSGIFFLIDDAFRVGEYIELDSGVMGEVEAITVRSIQLRNHRGPVITIPFGEVKQITNHNRDWVIYKMRFRLEPDTDPQKVKKIVKAVGAEFMAHPDHGPKFIEPVKSQGVHSIDDDSALIMRVKFKCKPRAQFVLRREIYHRLRAVFAENDIHFARRKVEVVGADGEAVQDPKKIALPDDVLQTAPPAAPQEQ